MNALSQRYRDSGQLVDLGLMHSSSVFEAHVRERAAA